MTGNTPRPRRRVWFVGALFALACLALCLALLAPRITRAQGTPLPQIRKEADRLFGEKSHALAAEQYRRWLSAAPADSLDRAEVEYRMAVSLGKAQRWDEAVTAVESFLKARESDPVWRARGEYWKGQLYLVLPHQGYKVGQRLYRGDDYPKDAGAEKPVQVYLYQEDRKAALLSFQAALKAFEAAPGGRRREHSREEADLHFDLARLLQGGGYEWLAGRPSERRTGESQQEALARWAKSIDWTIDPGKPYDPTWPTPKRVLFLYARLPRVRPGDEDVVVQAELRRALYVAQEKGRQAWVIRSGGPKNDVLYRLPYDSLEPVDILRAAYKRHPRHPQAPQLRLIVATWLNTGGDYVGAVKEARDLIARYPNSKWAPDARQLVADTTRREMSLDTPGTVPPGRPAILNLSTRNLRRVTLRAYKVDLAAVLTAEKALGDHAARFGALERFFGPIKEARTKGRQVAEWSVTTADKGEHEPLIETVTAPLKEVGAYLVEASAADDTVRAAGLILISDLAVVKKADRDRNLCFVVNAATGRPVAGASLVVREPYSNGKVAVARGKSDGEGLFSAARPEPGASGQTAEVLAWAPGDRYALSEPAYWNGDWHRDQSPFKGYGYTDRPVYRPKQTVQFRHVIAKRTGGSDFAPVKGATFHVVASNPKGEQVFDANLTSTEFGSVSGKFDLPAGAALGMYSVAVWRDRDGSTENVGSFQFRVEEYKKPEFEVKVAPGTEQARFGDTVKATINATYYWGAPVAGGKVAYKVFRTPHYPYYRFPRPYDWFFDFDAQRRDAYYGRGQGELVAQGTGTTDAKGDVAVSFVAQAGDPAADYSYSIQAEVTDPSRRVIEGEGSVKVARRGFYAYLDVKRGFYLAGDIAQVEVRTQDANEKPVAAKGTLTVYKLDVDAKGNETATPIHTQQVATDADGKALTTWRTDDAGRFRAEFAALDRFEQEVKGAAPLWVGRDGDAQTKWRIGGFALIPDKSTYAEGETARVLVIADQPDSWLLLTQEAGAEILGKRLVHVEGRTATLDIPIVRAHAPNFALAAVAVRDYQFFQWQRELFVPPVKRFAGIQVAASKPEFKPGEKGKFRIKATDAAGAPVAAEVSLAVFDSALTYIQTDLSPDIRRFYYDERRPVEVNVSGSFEFDPNVRQESDLPREQFKVHGIRIPEVGRVPGGETDLPFYYDSRVQGRRDARRREMPQSMAGASGGFGGNMAAPRVSAAAAPAPAFANDAYARKEDLTESAKRAKRVDGAPGDAPARVRSDFRDTAFWTPAVVTDKKTGEATLEVSFPDTLTTWKSVARGLTSDVQVGVGEASVVTDKKLQVRLAAPRFFVERDRVTLSAIVRNGLKTAKKVKVRMETDPALLALTPSPSPAAGEGGKIAMRDAHSAAGKAGRRAATREVTIPAGGEQRVDFEFDVKAGGDAMVRTFAETDEESDATELSFPVLSYGVQKFVMESGVMKDDQHTATVTLNVPKDHRAGTAALLVQVNPSLAGTMLDALPYLADYPYGCVEQTMSRFLPSVLVAKALQEAGADLTTLRKRAEAMRAREAEGTPFGQARPIDKNTDQTGYTYPSGTPGVLKAPQLAEGLYHTGRWKSPVFDPAELKRMTDEGMERLVGMQKPDGGWGWWAGSDYSDPYMSAYVVYGLATAKAADVAVPAGVLEKGFAFLEKDIVDRDDDRHTAVWEAYALSLRGKLPVPARKIVDGLYDRRDRLSAYGQALLALTLHNEGQKERAQVVCRNLLDSATVDRENGTASWRTPDSYWWAWYNNDAETVSWVLRAFTAVQPESDLNPMLVKWLVNHKRGNAWRSTKETAMAVYALTDYLRQSKELASTYTVTVALGNKAKRTFQIDPTNALLFDNRFLVPAELLAGGGAQAVTLTKEGKGRLYYSAAVQYVSTEQKIMGTGTELKVDRRYFRLTQKGKAGEGKALEYERTALGDGAALKSGDLVEVEMVVEAKNDYEYLIFEDMKPAGCEPVDRRSGSAYGDRLCSNVELRDTKTAFFVDRLPQGRRVLRYRLRAEVPGAFHALPTNAYAMYATDVRSISDSWDVKVSD